LFFLDVLRVAVVLALITVHYAGSSDSSFEKFLGAALLATVVFALVSSASRTSEAPDVRPVTLVLGNKPLARLFIGAFTDRVFIAEVCAKGTGSEIGDASTGALIDVPRKYVSAMLIGANTTLEDAISRERSLLTSLIRLGAAKKSAITAAGPPPATPGNRRCTGRSALP
jgi:hypothetical protein